MAKRFSVEAVFKAVDRVTKPITRMQNRVSKMTRSMARGLRNVDRAADKLRGGFKKMVTGAAVGIALLGTVLTGTVLAGANFEQAITNVGAVSLRTRDQIAPLEKMALQLGKTTKFTATEAANAMEILARAGFDVNQILTATPAILSAAAASGLEIAEVADHVSNVLKGMGLEMDQAARVADVLALASSRTNSTIGTLGESMRNVAATARQLNIPLEDTVAAVALLQDVGLDASVAGSALNTMLTKMAAPSKKITKQMKKFGVSFKDSEGNMLSFAKVIEQLNKASKKAGGNFDQVAFLAELVGLRGQKAAANLSDLFETGKLKTLIRALNDAKGSADKMAAIRMDTLRGSFLLLQSAVNGVAVRITDMTGGPMKDAIDKTTEWVALNEELIASEIGAFIKGVVDNFKDIVKWAKRVVIGITAFLALSLALKTFIGIMTAINLVAAANPFVLILGSVVILSAALVTLLTNLENVQKFFSEMKDPLADSEFFRSRSFFSSGRNEEQAAAAAPAPFSPQDRIARTIEQSTTNKQEVTIKDETGRAEVTGGTLGGNLKLQRTGAF